VEEAGSDVARSAYQDASVVFSVSLAYVEATSALARMRKGNRITAAQRERKQTELERMWRGLYVHSVDDATIELAARSASEDALRAYDAIHLAAALAFGQGGDVTFACWDTELRAAASARGFALVPESL
jgi:uncharacterized protein